MSDPTRSPSDILDDFFRLRLDDPEVMAALQQAPLGPFMAGVTLGGIVWRSGQREALAQPAPKKEDHRARAVRKGEEALDNLLDLVEQEGADALPAEGRARLVERIETFLAKGGAPDPGTPEALAGLDWHLGLGGPGERVLLLAAQGFRAVGRNEAAKRAEESAGKVDSDEGAVRVLRGGLFRWNELADLSFPIRKVLGFNEHGQVVDRHGMPIEEIG